MSRSPRRFDRRFSARQTSSVTIPYTTTNMLAFYDPAQGVTGGSSPTLWTNLAPAAPSNSNLQNVGAVVRNSSDGEFNGYPCMDFTASTALCMTSVGVWGSAIPLGSTYIFVGRVKSASIVTFHGLIDGYSGARNAILYDPTSSPQPVMFAGTAAVTSTPSLGLTSVSIVWATFNGASSTWGINSKTATGSGNPGSQTNTRLIVGGHSLTPGSLTNGSQGKMGQVLVYSSLSSGDRNTILDALSVKYGIAVAP